MRDELTARLRATFLQELEEQVRELNGGLLALEQNPGDAETVRTLFRSAHTIKGAARVANAPLIEETCHVLESVFARLRQRQLELDGGNFSLLFAVVDALSTAGDLLRRNEPLEGSGLSALITKLHDLAGSDTPSRVTQSDLAETGAPRTSRAAPRDAADNRPPKDEGVDRRSPSDAAADRRDPLSAPAPAPASAKPDAPRSLPAAAPAAAQAARPEPVEEMVRVRADRLDSLLSVVGELIVATGRIVQRHGSRDEDARRLDRTTDSIADVVRHLRLRPFSDVCEALPRVVRDIAAAEGKQVELQIEGQDVEADRMVVDALREPLLHLVRNAVDHGIESPAERERQGKQRTGHVRIAADLQGGRLRVTVEDDGAGLDEDAIASALRARSGRSPESPDEIADALLAGGLTTRGEATAISGRGVGVNLVRAAMDRIGGTVDLHWARGKGTAFTLECPPTPSSIRAVLFRVGPHIFALPTLQIERLRLIRAEQIRHAEGRAILPTPDGPVAVHMLATLLGPPLEARPIEGAAPLIMVNAGGRRAGVIVDEVLDEDELVVRPLDIDERAVPWATGAALLPSGRVALLLGTAALLARTTRAGTTIAPAFAARRETPRRRIIVADDSITTRTLEQSVLEAAGFEVVTAVDGEDAWQRLEADGADLLVADVEMPRMDGFALCRRVRGSARFADLPIVLVTGLASDENRARGLDAGADAYIVKSSFDQESLIGTVQQLIGDA
jgi:two-component system, chemotaxis family, sensor kinase CheA